MSQRQNYLPLLDRHVRVVQNTPTDDAFDWIKLLDDKHNQYYYFNLTSKESRWEPPPEWDEAKGELRKQTWERHRAERKARREAKARYVSGDVAKGTAMQDRLASFAPCRHLLAEWRSTLWADVVDALTRVRGAGTRRGAAR